MIFCGVNSLWQLALLVASIILNFFIGSAIQKRDAQKKLFLIAGISADILLLGIFKYSNFVSENLNLIGFHIPLPNIPLPAGISFYTFTQIAYLVDCYAGKGPKKQSLPTYVLFVTYFPHLIAGPIIHWREMMPQFRALAVKGRDIFREPAYHQSFHRGCSLFAIGLFKKILIADQLATFVDAGYKTVNTLGSIDAWMLSLAYTFQLYFDFSGYTDMAIGMSLLFGIQLPFNFNSPYKASSIQDFWRRWHMTLSRWLRDYVFIPMGGSHNGTAKTLRNLAITFLVGGIWHGAAWTFIVWGAAHGVAMCVNRLWQIKGWRIHPVAATALTFLFVNLAWVFFRAPDMASALHVISLMASFKGGSLGLSRDLTLWALLGISAAIVWKMPNSQTLVYERKLGSHFATPAVLGAAVMVAIIAANTSQPSPFIYFNF